MELSTRPVPARKSFEHQLNRETFCVLLQMVRVLFAVLNHALSRDGLDCSDGTIQEFNAFKTAKCTMQVWQYLSDEGVTELDPQLPVLEWAVHFDKDSVHSALKRALEDALPLNWVDGQWALRWKLTKACKSLAWKLQTDFKLKPQSEEFKVQWGLRINQWAVEATNQFYLVLHGLAQYVRHGAQQEPLDFGHPVANPTSAQEADSCNWQSWGESESWSSSWQQPSSQWQQRNDAPPRRRWADWSAVEPTASSDWSDWGRWRPQR